MSLCVIAAGLQENILVLAVGLLGLALGFAGTRASRIVVVSMRRTLRCVALGLALYVIADAARRASSYAESRCDNVLALLNRIFAVQVDPPTQ
jgi:predicted transporter